MKWNFTQLLLLLIPSYCALTTLAKDGALKLQSRCGCAFFVKISFRRFLSHSVSKSTEVLPFERLMTKEKKEFICFFTPPPYPLATPPKMLTFIRGLQRQIRKNSLKWFLLNYCIVLVLILWLMVTDCSVKVNDILSVQSQDKVYIFKITWIW